MKLNGFLPTLKERAYTEGEKDIIKNKANQHLESFKKQIEKVFLEFFTEVMAGHYSDDTIHKLAEKTSESKSSGFIDGFNSGFINGYMDGDFYGATRERLTLLASLVREKILTIEQAAERSGYVLDEFLSICSDELGNDI